MSDTQWPRWVVLHQSQKGKPHEYAGSVHAPDSELALLNARDVFVRRPECVSLWVVRARDILSVTAEELAGGIAPTFLEAPRPADDARLMGDYHIFLKIGQKQPHRQAGQVQGESAAEAMRRALETFSHEKVFVWWVFAAAAVTCSTAGDIEALFAAAATKRFRDQGEYHTIAMLRKLRAQAEQERQVDAE